MNRASTCAQVNGGMAPSPPQQFVSSLGAGDPTVRSWA